MPSRSPAEQRSLHTGSRACCGAGYGAALCPPPQTMAAVFEARMAAWMATHVGVWRQGQCLYAKLSCEGQGRGHMDATWLHPQTPDCLQLYLPRRIVNLNAKWLWSRRCKSCQLSWSNLLRTANVGGNSQRQGHLKAPCTGRAPHRPDGAGNCAHRSTSELRLL